MTRLVSQPEIDIRQPRINMMSCKSHNLLPLWLQILFAFFSSISVTHAQNHCGSLITYRQYGVLLEQAPLCFRNGCDDPKPSGSMSSTCASNSACYPLWEVLRKEWQDDWCSACGGDIACRIPGWPILNSTAACDVSPSQWLFSAAGPCCATGEEPFQLAEWIGGLCNGSQWRTPFESYGGMAQSDWAEWIEPWNWTVRRENTSTGNSTFDDCKTSYATLAAMGIDNAVSIGSSSAEILVAWLILIFLAKSRDDDKPFVLAFRDEVKTWPWALVGGLGSGFGYILSNFATAIIWNRYYPGYQNMETGYVGLALCARPSVLGFLCFLGLFSKPVSRRIDRWRTRTMRTPDPNADGEHIARQLLANWAFTLAVGELFVQISGYYSLLVTTTEGRRRGFYRVGSLIPFWRGSEAQRMYAGAMVHCIFFFLSVISLLVSTYVHARTAKFQKRLSRRKRVNRLLSSLGTYYLDQEGNAHLYEQINRKQRIVEDLVTAMEGRTRSRDSRYPKLAKAVRGTKATLGRVASWVLRHSRTNAPTPPSHQGIIDNIIPDPVPVPLTRRGRILSSWPFSIILLSLVKLTTSVRAEQSQRDAEKYQRSQPPSRAAYDILVDRANRLAAQDQDKLSWRFWLLGIVFGCVSVNYISQWCFWSGYVQSSGDRQAESLPRANCD
jgi:hypothetical protein